MKAWQNEGFHLVSVPQMTVDEVKTCANLQVLDVRSPSEWKKGHIPCATHLFLPEIPKRAKALKKADPVVTYCATGYRASLAASLLQQEGFKDVRNMPGSFTAWKNAGLPIEKEKEGGEKKCDA
jgi:hydroxyacylglutathione hydrolase